MCWIVPCVGAIEFFVPYDFLASYFGVTCCASALDCGPCLAVATALFVQWVNTEIRSIVTFLASNAGCRNAATKISGRSLFDSVLEIGVRVSSGFFVRSSGVG